MESGCCSYCSTSPSVAHPCRTRRHRAAITICSLLYADACPPLRAPERAAQALALGAPAAATVYLLIAAAVI